MPPSNRRKCRHSFSVGGGAPLGNRMLSENCRQSYLTVWGLFAWIVGLFAGQTRRALRYAKSGMLLSSHAITPTSAARCTTCVLGHPRSPTLNPKSCLHACTHESSRLPRDSKLFESDTGYPPYIPRVALLACIHD